MDSLPPDPYVALGVAKDATAAAIKQQYRKLVLRLHPDKVQDEALKQAAADQFHKVQTAYEIVGDDDRRSRYDAQCRLAELRRDVVERDGGAPRRGPDFRTAAFKAPTDSGEYFARGPERSGRMSPRYEERRPNFDYFDQPPRPTSRKDADFDRSSKRTPPREDPKKSKTSSRKTKENERSSRDERARQNERDVRKERERKDNDRKFAFVTEHSPISDSDEYDRARRPRREDEDGRNARAAMMEEERRKEQEAAASFFGAERTQKMFNQDYIAREYMSKGSTTPLERPAPERRPSPVRKASSREHVEYIDRKDGRPPVMIRRGSGKPQMARDARKASSREKDIDIVEEPEEVSPRSTRPPTLSKMNSSPANIRPAFERQRSNSAQYEPKDFREAPIPGMRRAETMPYPSTTSKPESRRTDPSKLRTEIPMGLPTPEVSPERQPRKGSAGQVYPDGDDYRTEFREPTYQPRVERSPSPINREPAQPRNPRRSTTRQYSYQIPPETADPATRRPSLQRESSSRLFGEVQSTRSPKPSTQRRASPPTDDISYVQRPRMEDVSQSQNHRPSLEKVRMASGSNRVRRSDKGYSSSRAATPVR